MSMANVNRMNNSILDEVKKTLGIEKDYTDFDVDILMHLNGIFVKLHQIGVGSNIFTVSDSTTKWSDLINDDRVALVKQYVYVEMRILFDPPQTSFVLSAMEKIAEQYEFRLNCMFDNPNEET